MITSKAENAYIALESLLKAIDGLGTDANGNPYVSRKLEDPSRVIWETTPAIFINETSEMIQPTKGFEGMHSVQTLNCNLYLYVYQGIQEGVCSTLINNMIEAIRQSLKPTFPDVYQTLSGTVSHCWVSGIIEIIEGVMDGQGIAIIPVNILTNN
jgi:hypothetical protein